MWVKRRLSRLPHSGNGIAGSHVVLALPPWGLGWPGRSFAALPMGMAAFSARSPKVQRLGSNRPVLYRTCGADGRDRVLGGYRGIGSIGLAPSTAGARFILPLSGRGRRDGGPGPQEGAKETPSLCSGPRGREGVAIGIQLVTRIASATSLPLRLVRATAVAVSRRTGNAAVAQLLFAPPRPHGGRASTTWLPAMHLPECGARENLLLTRTSSITA